MICPSCGAENPAGSAYCARCSRALAPEARPVGPHLSWQTEEGPPQVLALQQSLTIGRVAGNDIVIADSAMSRQHARVELTPTGVAVVDLGSLNGVFVNDERVDNARDLGDGDVIRVGRTRLTLSLPIEPAPPQAAAEPGEPAAERTVLMAGPESPEPAIEERTLLAPAVPLEPEAAAAAPERHPVAYLVAGEQRVPLYDTLTIGRAAGNDIHISDDRLMSRNHARIESRPDGVWVVDNNSANGTFVDDARVTEPVKLNDQAQIRFGASLFRFEAAKPPLSPPGPSGAGTETLVAVPSDSGATIIASAIQEETLQGSEAEHYIREAELAEFQALRAGDTEPHKTAGVPPTDKYHLIVNFGPEAGRHFALDKDVTVIGRASDDADYDIQLNDRAVSRPHAKIVKEPDGFTIYDLESANGTWLNYTEELTAPRKLVDGDIIKLGKTTLVYRVPLSSRSAQPEPALDLTTGQIVTAFSLKGGVGTTSVAVNLAITLRRLTSQSVLLIDLSTERGAVSVHLNLSPKLTLADLPADPTLIDLDALRSIIVTHTTGVDVLPAPPSPQTAEMVTAAAVSAVLPIARACYKWVVVDTSSTFSELNLGVFDQSDLILLVFAPDVTSLKIIQSTLDVLAALQLPAEKRVLVLNQTHARAHVNKEDLEKTLGERIGLVLPYAEEAILDAIDRGVALAEARADHPTVAAIEGFAAKLAQVKSAAGEQPRGRFGQWVQGVLGSIRHS